MEPEIRKQESFLVLGLVTRIARGSESPELFGKIWRGFEAYHQRIKPISTEPRYYGVSFPTAGPDAIDYLAGMATGENAAIPEGLEVRTIPAADYAVFSCPVHDIGAAYSHIFGQWLPTSPFALNRELPSFEQYPPAGEEQGQVSIHIPVIRKSPT